MNTNFNTIKNDRWKNRNINRCLKTGQWRTKNIWKKIRIVAKLKLKNII